jgi:hypothetical protein
MATRYPLSSRRGGRYFGTSRAGRIVRSMIKRGVLQHKTVALQESERLDIVAQRVYGDSSMWWIIAAASNIGWGLQVPAGTYLIIPTDVNQIFNAIG